MGLSTSWVQKRVLGSIRARSRLFGFNRLVNRFLLLFLGNWRKLKDLNECTRYLRAPSEPKSDLHSESGAHASNCPARQLDISQIGQDDLSGFSLDCYDLGPRVGSGGMGTVYSAFHRLLQKKFAIKFIGEQISSDKQAIQRFEQEILALGKLNHPHIVSAIDAGHFQGIPYLVTELIAGSSLQEIIQSDGPMESCQALSCIRQAATGLLHAHDLGFVHRDIKPSNILTDQHNSVKILDFGLVRSITSSDDQTTVGQMLGTLDYLAPEQAIDASSVDHRCDIYSLGCTLIYLITGKPPYSGERYSSPVAKMKGHMLDEPSCLSETPFSTNENLRSIVQRMISKSPEARFSNIEQFLNDLTERGLIESHKQHDSHVDHDLRPTDSKSLRSQSRRRSLMMTCGSLALIACSISAFVYSTPLRVAVGIDRNQTKSTASNDTPVAPEDRAESSSIPSSMNHAGTDVLEESALNSEHVLSDEEKPAFKGHSQNAFVKTVDFKGSQNAPIPRFDLPNKGKLPFGKVQTIPNGN